MERIQRTLRIVNEELPMHNPSARPTQSASTPEIKAESEILSNSKQIAEIQKLLDSLK
jgi:hypothetical protein